MLLTQEQLISLLKTTLLGVAGLFCILWINSFFIRWISVLYEIRMRGLIARRAYNRALFVYFVSVSYLALVQLGAVAIWAVALLAFKVVGDPIRALLFAGSCYTTIGIVADIASEGWSLLPVFIAISGLFAFALSTAAVLSMANLFRRAWYSKHAKRIRAMIEAEGIDLSDADISDETRTLFGYKKRKEGCTPIDRSH